MSVRTAAGRLRARLERRPAVVRGLVVGLACAALVALAANAAGLLVSLDHLRRSARASTSVADAAVQAELLLERAVGDAAAGRSGWADAAPSLARAGAITDRILASGEGRLMPPHVRRDFQALRATVGQTGAVVLAPAAPPPATTGALLAAARASVDAITHETARFRERDRRRISRSERWAVIGGAVINAAVLVLLAGAVMRLLESRRRLAAARDQERLEALRLERAVNGMREGVALFNSRAVLVLLNRHFPAIAGLEGAAVELGAPFAALRAALAGGEPPVLAEPLGGEGRREISADMRLGDRVLQVFRAQMPGGGELLTLADVTRRAQSEEAARRTAKLEALGQLTGGVAHDFNNLLQALSANLELVAAAGNGPEGAAERGERLRATLDLVERGTRLTRHLLSFARARPASAGPVDTAHLLGSLADLLARTIGDRIELQMVLEPGLWPVLADRSGLENAILNLAINARDAMPEGGVISIVASNQPAAGGEGAAVVLCVADSGFGMDADQLRRATEPFFTSKPDGVGTGLGLAMVAGFAAASGGAFGLESERGRGTRATLRLPRAADAPGGAAQGGGAPPGVPVRGRGELILLVEDDHAVRRAVSSGLRAIGYRVVEAGSADAGVRVLADGLWPDLLLSDVMLPGSVTPAELLRVARARAPALPVLFNTGDEDAPAARDLPLDARTVLLLKPWRLDVMATALRTLLEPAPPGPAARARAASLG